MNASTIKQLTRSRDLRNALNKEASWEELFEQNMYKEAGFGSAAKKFVTNPAGGAGLKGRVKQGLNKVVSTSGITGPAAGAVMYANDPDKPASAAALGILAPWLATRTKARYKDAVKAGHKGVGVPTDMLANMTPELVAKMGLGGGAAAFDYGMAKGPEIAGKVEKGVEDFQDTMGNVRKITKDVGDVTEGSKKHLTSGLSELGKGTSSLGKEIGKSGKGVNKALEGFSKTLDESGGALKNVGELADAAKKKLEGDNEKGGLDLLGIKGAIQHVKNNSGKYALAGGGLAALAAYVMYRNRKESEESEEAVAKRKEREIRALNRMARAQEAS